MFVSSRTDFCIFPFDVQNSAVRKRKVLHLQDTSGEIQGNCVAISSERQILKSCFHSEVDNIHSQENSFFVFLFVACSRVDLHYSFSDLLKWRCLNIFDILCIPLNSFNCHYLSIHHTDSAWRVHTVRSVDVIPENSLLEAQTNPHIF